ncbi:ABC transporter ATP-binding protein [Aurantimonas sp. MSK8Z-1]|uniref:ABC transporter ATP-binding protein n=1 Tax=Mangrovibrevibacter kandeliae TaxID=2968473 RepID=UPI0021180F98|nr:ABC transporter ATP-binding protein [Aurantimonas sp. MSK8Z-1]MCW4114309.1 ABC transporter ATP-binding protein [Aurantimonas sp. MSK8Z-1]
MADLLVVENLSAGYGKAVAIERIGFALKTGGALALLGRNGVGKTTLLNTLIGVTTFKGGRITLDGTDVTSLSPERRARAGIGWVPQERNIFASLTVEENLTAIARPGPWGVARVYQMFPRLKERRANMGNQLSGGEQQMLALGRALMINPKLLLLDEPLEGLAPVIVDELLAALRRIVVEEAMTAIIVEQKARKILPFTDHALILERGTVSFAGPSAQLLEEPGALEARLGVERA